MNTKNIILGHGSGGKLTNNLIKDIFVKHFKNSHFDNLNDSSLVATSATSAFTTDSFVIDPIFFPGGDIGKLAVSGTVNDLLVSGAIPKYLSAGFIIEEGLPIDDLEKIATSMAEEARIANIEIVTGDTKVVKKGQCDKLFINTAGIGHISEKTLHLGKNAVFNPGDKIIVSGYLGDHTAAILAVRNNITFDEGFISDVAPLNDLILPLVNSFSQDIKFMRDITRGGLATILNEICNHTEFGIKISETSLPIRKQVSGFCEIFGYDPLYLANEGKIIMVVKNELAEKVISDMKKLPYGEHAETVGEITKENVGKVLLDTAIGGTRIVDMLSGEMLPRIC